MPEFHLEHSPGFPKRESLRPDSLQSADLDRCRWGQPLSQTGWSPNGSKSFSAP
jgi:hypothetical protein